MDIRIEKPLCGGEIRAIASKPHSHRMLICAALADDSTYIECAETSGDTDATVGCLKSLGAQISHDGKGFSVHPAKFPISEELVTQVCGESGSTLRFMMPICCALGVPADFKTLGRLRERPASPLLEQLVANGSVISMQKGNLQCSGKLSAGEFSLRGNISSQFISGLLLALPLLSGESVINVEGRVDYMPYVTMTLDVLGAFGVAIKHRGSRAGRGAVFLVEGPQSYRSPGAIKVEGDWLNAACWLCAGALGSGITCSGLNLGSRQGDMAIMRFLERFGANVTYGGDSVTVAPGKLRGIQIDASDAPDLVPLLAAVASVSKGETVISNVGKHKIKESDRLRATTETLRTLGADVSETQDGLVIKGKKNLRGGEIPSLGDHWIVSMAAIASIVCEDQVTIKAAEAASRLYPGFFKDFEALGGEISQT